MTGLDLAEHIVDGRLRQQARGMTEMLGCRRLREGAERPEEGDAQRVFQRQAGRHDLAEEEGDALVGQRALVEILDAAQHLGLALRAIHVAGLAVAGLDLAHVLGASGALVEQRQQLCIDGIDLVANHAQFLQHRLVHAVS